MDLMFDVQALGAAPPDAVSSIAAYYRRVTTAAYPMYRLIAAVMLLMLGGLVYRVVRGGRHRGATLLALLLALGAIGLAAVRVVPNAVRLGAAGEPSVQQAALARTIAIDHLLCLALMTACVVVIVAEALGGDTHGRRS
jgi:hypothetical protein